MTMLNPWSSMAQQPSPSEVVTEEITINADSASTNSVATYKGGYNALLTALAKNIQYPAECAEANIQGKVVLRIGVDENGKSADITVLRSVHLSMPRQSALPRCSPTGFRAQMPTGTPLQPISPYP